MDSRTKQLVQRLQPGEIAVIQHRDLDEVAADALIAARVKAVINTEVSISGRYPNLGPLKLLQANVVLLDRTTPALLTRLADGSVVQVIDNRVLAAGTVLGEGERLTEQEVLAQMARALLNVRSELEQFVENTLTFANQEKSFFLGDLPVLQLRQSMQARHVLVVVRGPAYKADLRAIATYIRERKPILIGVDGGADALLEAGFRPDFIVGDMDSVSDTALRMGAELIVHAYPDGRAPGMERIRALGLQAHLYPAPGTSEDIAMLLAHENGAELIVALGTHSNMIDFLEKGRRGMASTVLTRMRIGNKLVDAKGVSQLYAARSLPADRVAWQNPWPIWSKKDSTSAVAEAGSDEGGQHATMKVAVLIPAWNEADRIDQTILAVRKLSNIDEIIVIDDGSTDETYRVSLEAGARVIRHTTNYGKGAALYSGILATSADVFVFLDADMGDTAVEIAKLIRPIVENRCDMTIGRLPRPLRGGFGLVKGFARRGILRLAGVDMQAPLSGQRALNRRVLDAIGRLGDGYGVEVAMTIDAARKGMRLLEVEVNMKNREYGRDLRGFWHRGKQFVQIARVLYQRWQTW